MAMGTGKYTEQKSKKRSSSLSSPELLPRYAAFEVVLLIESIELSWSQQPQ
jgi:hypothetical protein